MTFLATASDPKAIFYLDLKVKLYFTLTFTLKADYRFYPVAQLLVAPTNVCIFLYS